MSEIRTIVGKFVKNTWTNMNIRCGKYKHLQTLNKNKVYENIKILFTREEYKEWCWNNKVLIESLKRPSIDRINSNKHYSLDNIQILELKENIKKKKQGSAYLNGPKSNLIRGIRKTKFNTYSARITINKKEKHLGTFKTKTEALNAFRNAYFEYYKKEPFCAQETRTQ